jgi:oligopeptide transport system ATP-binding protein
MYAGKIVEIGTAEEIFYNPQHPYTWGLLGSMPTLEGTSDRLYAIPGTPPDLLEPPLGDAFYPRNEFALKIDAEEQPPFFEVSPTHKAATWLLAPQAPKVTPPEEIQIRWAKFKEKQQGRA